ncbi:DUF2339 domain-containing protein [Paenibacillus kyungheensis]
MDHNDKVEQLEQRILRLEREVAELKQLEMQRRPASPPPVSPNRTAPPPPSGSPFTPPPPTSNWQDAYVNAPPPKGNYNARPQAQPQSGPFAGAQRPPVQAPYTPPVPKPPKDWEHLIARVWLPRVFIVVLILGIVWGFIAVVKAGYLSEPIRCILGVLVAAVLYWLGEREVSKERPALGKVLLGGSIAILILSIVASYLLYDLLPFIFAFLLYIGALVFGVYIALSQRSQSIVGITLIAGYLAPVLIAPDDPNLWIFAGFETIFSAVMLVVAMKYSFRVSYILAFALLHITLGLSMIWYGFSVQNVVAVLIQHAVILAISVLWKKRSTSMQLGVLFTSFAFVGGWLTIYYLDGSETGARWMIAILSLMYSILYASGIQKRTPVGIAYPAMAIFGWFLLLNMIPNFPARMAVILVEGTLAFLLALRFRNKLQLVLACIVYAYALLATLFVPIERFWSASAFNWLILLITIPAIYQIIGKWVHSEDKVYGSLYRKRYILMWAEAILGLIYLSQLVHVASRFQNADVRHLSLSSAWIIYAILIIVIGMVVQKSKLRIIGILFIFFTLLKIIFIDLPDISIGVRAILFIILGVVGLGLSRLFYKRRDNNGQPPSQEPPLESNIPTNNPERSYESSTAPLENRSADVPPASPDKPKHNDDLS